MWIATGVAVLMASSLCAQVAPFHEGYNAAALRRALARLGTTLTVLHITAHPDDEDGALLARLSWRDGVRTGLLTLNRGEGGANVAGPELFDALGLVRTEELLASGRYYGVDQFFTRLTDFGFSKRLDETLEHWGRDNLMRDVVRAVRWYRPDIIVARFHGLPRDGHGNHQAAGLAAAEVFEMAADPARFPEHFREGLRPWQAKKLYRSLRPNEPATLRIEVGDYDPLLGRSYRELAREGLNFQRSQNGGGAPAPRGAASSNLELVKSVLPKSANERTLDEGLDASISALAALAPGLPLAAIQDHARQALERFDARQPWTVMPHVTAGLRAVREAIAKAEAASFDTAKKDHLLFLLRNKEQEFQEAAHLALGVALEVMASGRDTFQVAIPGQQFTLTALAHNRSQVRLENVSLSLQAPGGWTVTADGKPQPALEYNQEARITFQVTVPADAEPTRPYWRRASPYKEHLYQIDQPAYLNLPHTPPPLAGVFTYHVDGVRFAMSRPAQVPFPKRPYGEHRRLLVVAPAIGVAVVPREGVVVAGAQSVFPLRVDLVANAKTEGAATVRLKLPPAWTSDPAEVTFKFAQEGDRQSFPFQVRVPQAVAGQAYGIQAVAEYGGKLYTEGYRVIDHRDLEPQHLYRPATVSLRGVEVKVAPGLKVGYIMGVGDEVPEALEQIGVTVTLLATPDLATGNLDQFHTILVGFRASAVRADVKAYNRRLLEYVERGGNLVWQYQTQEFDALPYGPYPFRMGRAAEEVSEEDARITVLEPRAAVFQTPNRITPADFEGWVEERGSKFLSEWDPRYQALLACNDRAQPPQKGGWLQAQYGRGTFSYVAYAFYRQLPAGVPGAYRLFANLISLGKK